MMKLSLALDPRRHVAASVGWAMFAVISLTSLIAAQLASAAAEERTLNDMQRLTDQFAHQVQQGLANVLRTRISIVQTTAAQIVSAKDRSSDTVRGHLEVVRSQFPEFLWLGITDDTARVMAATNGVLEGASASALPWARGANGKAFLGSMREATEMPGGHAQRVIDLGTPLRNAAGQVVGVAGAHLNWQWIEQVHHKLVAALDAREQAELFLVAEDGTVLVGPPAWLGRKPSDADLAEGHRYLVGSLPSDSVVPWSIKLRQSTAAALAAAQSTGRSVFWVVLLSGLLTSMTAVLLTQLLLSRLGRLSSQAANIRAGLKSELEPPRGNDEIGQIGRTMADLVQHLQHEKDALARLNAELDSRVAERSVQIKRMADENRYAAVTRERLRLARDLHDTLAHSLMALLAQIRLIRKLQPRLSREEVEQELARTEEVATDGLAQARAAITEMRFNGVQDAGLGVAVRDLATRFVERTGVQVELQGFNSTELLTDERVETVFRIIEEAMRNVENHALARSVLVEMGIDPGSGEHVIRVTDDGQGFDLDLAVPGHYGLVGMREQAALIGARLLVRSHAGTGTVVELYVSAAMMR